MKAVKKVELIIPTSVARGRLQEVLDNLNIEGYSMIQDVTGKGVNGMIYGDLTVDVNKSTYILIATDEDRIQTITDAFRPIINRYGGMCLVSNAEMIMRNESDLPKK
jgi:hypothetical protein